MPPPSQRQADEIELLPRPASPTPSSSSDRSWHLDESDPFQPHSPSSTTPRSLRSYGHRPGFLTRLLSFIFAPRSRKAGSEAYSYPASRKWGRKRWQLFRRLKVAATILSVLIAVLACFTAIFNPSYTHLPSHYQALAEQAAKTGRANPNKEKVFIAANIIDADLIDGAWGEAVLSLVELLGQENVYLSVFENDSGNKTTEALKRFEKKIRCESSIISEHLPVEEVPAITLPSGRKRVKRIAYLAEVRNRALRPLDKKHKRSFNKHKTIDRKFDKVLFINDIVFSPLDAAQLLFSTNVDGRGKTQYRAACAVDFINPFKFYDTFATRDLEGFGMGVPFFPWFSSAGQAMTRQDVLAGKDAVRVRSCWGGMVSFDAKWLQEQDTPPDPNHALATREIPNPVRFRAETDTFWDASECCLIHADIQRPKSDPSSPEDVGIFINPFVRVAYSARSHSWLGFTRRFEKMYSIPHSIVNRLAGLPFGNPRRLESEGQTVTEKVWVYDDPNWQEEEEEEQKKKGGSSIAGKRPQLKNGSFQMVERVAGRGGFCGSRMLLVLKPDAKPGGKKWEKLPIPPG